MFGIEQRRGAAVIGREVSEALALEEAVASAEPRAIESGADNIRVFDARGIELGVYPVRARPDA